MNAQTAELAAKVEEKVEILEALKRAAKMEKEFGGVSSLGESGGTLAIRTVGAHCEMMQYMGRAKGTRKCGINPAKVAKWLAAAGGRKDVVQIASMNDQSFEMDVGDHEYVSSPSKYIEKSFEWDKDTLATYKIPAGSMGQMLKHVLPYHFQYHGALDGMVLVAASAAGFRLVATDGHRMGLTEHGSCAPDNMAKAVIPAAALRLLDATSVWHVDVCLDGICVTTDTVTMRIKGIPRPYPDADRVRVKDPAACTVKVPAQDFANKIKPLHALDKDVKIWLTGSLTADAAHNGAKAKTGWDVDASQQTGDTSNIKCMLDGGYLNQMAQLYKGKGGTVEFKWNAPTNAVAFQLHEEGSSVMVEHTIMPLSPPRRKR